MDSDIKQKNVIIEVCGKSPRKVRITAYVQGYLCAHPQRIIRNDIVLRTDSWVVSHWKTGRGACGHHTFEHKRDALRFMRLLDPTNAVWSSTDARVVASRAAPIYQEALRKFRGKDDSVLHAKWVPDPGTEVIEVSRHVRTRKENARIVKVKSVSADSAYVTLANGHEFEMGQSGGWISRVVKNKTPGVSRTFVPNGLSNRKRFILGI